MVATLVAGRYELGPALGRGGMADVHAGVDRRLGREIAVKVMRSDLARDPVFRERFEREAQHVAGLNHPGIVAVYDTGEMTLGDGDDGGVDASPALPYIVMEYVRGSTLRDFLRTDGAMTPERACAVMIEVCRALDFSHRRGIVHRDVKPANVMVTPDGVVKVMDFGIARAISQTRTGLTAAESVIGTAQYLSPEQGLGKGADARSDVYACGCVLHELLTGEPPFTGDSPVAIVYQHVREDAPLVSERCDPASATTAVIASGLDAVVRQALTKNPDNRYESADAMADDLERVLDGRTPHAPAVLGTLDDTTEHLGAVPAPRDEDTAHVGRGPVTRGADQPATGAHALPGRPRRRRALVAAAAVVLALLVGAGLWWQGSRSDVPAVSGQPQADAEHAISAAGLVPVAVAAPSAPEQNGRVLSTDPPSGGALARGATVTLTVGHGPGQVAVPSLLGAQPEAARQAATAAGLMLTPVPRMRDTDDPAQVGAVLAQDPAAGTLRPPGTAIALTIGQRRATLAVPDVVGRDRQTAISSLQGVGLPVTNVQEVDGPAPRGSVVGTNPAAGTRVPTGSDITLLVARGASPAPPAPVPPPGESSRPDSGSEGSRGSHGSDSSSRSDRHDDGDSGSGGSGGGGLFPHGVFGNE